MPKRGAPAASRIRLGFPRQLIRRCLWIALGLAVALVSCRPGGQPVARPGLAVASAATVQPPPSRTPRIAPTQPAPTPSPPVPTGPLVVRVGLASDLSSVTLPCCDQRLTLNAGEATIQLSQAVEVAPAGTLSGRAIYRLQVAALKDEQQAHGLAEQLAKTSGLDADAVFDAGSDLYRVRVGRFARREEAEAMRGRLEALGAPSGWVASEGGALDDPAFEIRLGGGTINVPGRWLEISAPRDVGIAYDGHRYRGSLLIFLNDRGNLNIVNELELEDYLRGVVPKEMGPELYKQLEALKAQSVAARTYTVRNLSEFAAEGFDICSTPRCQVYGGMAVEHPFSDRAIAETAGQVVLYEGSPAETLYGATCGGHTEDVEVVFPLKQGAYLRGVPCMEAGVGRLAGDLAAGTSFPAGLTRRLLPVARGKPHRVLAARMEHLAELASQPMPRDRLRSMQRQEVLRFATSVYDLALDRRLRSSAAELEQLLEDPPSDWRRRDLDLAEYLISSGLVAGQGDGVVSAEAAEELLYRLAVYLRVIERQSGRFLAVRSGRLEAHVAGARKSWELPGHLATFRYQGGVLRAAPLDLLAGDRIELYWHRGELVGLAQPVDAPTVDISNRVPKQSWSRFKSTRELRAAVQARYPGFPFEGFKVLSRGVSGRVGKLELQGAGGRTLLVEGLAVRWTLDVWDTLFWAEPSSGDRGSGWVFRGKGWGHGVGMCQAGAFGMAVRGASYREILSHYYTGIQLGRLKPAPERPRLAKASDPASR